MTRGKNMAKVREDDGAEVGAAADKANALDRASRGEQKIVRENWERYVYVSDRGHYDYCQRARRLEDLYVGGGRQWREADRDTMEAEGRYPIEVNETKDAVNTALGYQINNRVDFAASPKKDTSEEKAKKFSKVLMKVKDDLRYGYYESEMFADGLIQQRGYLDLRVYYDENINGEPGLFLYDPMDVIPDPDAKSYDPDDWADVIVTRWLTGDEIEGDYGPDKRAEVEAQYGVGVGEEDFGDSLNEEARNRFGDEMTESGGADAMESLAGIPRYRVIDRQYWKIAPCATAIFPTGDIRNIENANPEAIKQAKADGAMILRRPMKRVRWTVSTENVLLHDDWSPYDHFTVIPFFPTFRRGLTRGMIDDLEGPQELLNSSVSTVNQIVRSAANSGWTVEQNSLTNMDTEDLEEEGAKNGLVVEYAKGAAKPEKIKPNPVPEGVRDLVDFASFKIKGVSGMTDAMRGQGGKTQSGLAAQSQQFAAQLSSAKTLENLAFSRRLFAQRLTKMLQQTLTGPQVFKITEMVDGEEVSAPLYANQPDPVTGELFDLTSGEYDFAISDQPTQITFQNNQFAQAMEMKTAGVNIPDHVLIKNSTLADKQQVIADMKASQQNPEAEAKALLMKAQAAYSEAQAIAKNIEALFSAARTAQAIAANPALAAASDAIAKSGGFVDKDAAPIYPDVEQPIAGAVTPPPNNTNPLTPDNPDAGMTTGIESGEAAGGM